MLLSHFLPEMISKDVDFPTLINVDNHDFNYVEGVSETQPGQLFFNSVVQFKDNFTSALPEHVRHRLSSISLKTDFKNIPKQVGDESVERQICQHVFNYMGLKKTVYARFPTLNDDNATTK